MPPSAPKSCYTASSPPVVAIAFEYSSEQLDALLAGRVIGILADTVGNHELEAIFAGISSTGFANDHLKIALKSSDEYKDWHVGEAIAEAFVVDNHNCDYPWPTSRDLKNPNASPAGCDLTGFQLTDDPENPYRFSFGEVKTSTDAKSPPGVMTDLGKQLFGLRDNQLTKSFLILYLARHSDGKVWLNKFESATKRYLSSDTSDIAIFGILLRDTAANDSDVKGKAKALANGCPEATNIVLIALYLPSGSIPTLPTKVKAIIDAESAI